MVLLYVRPTTEIGIYRTLSYFELAIDTIIIMIVTIALIISLQVPIICQGYVI
jgi:hypothetical protein